MAWRSESIRMGKRGADSEAPERRRTVVAILIFMPPFNGQLVQESGKTTSRAKAATMPQDGLA
jgi:hypothetical protein